MKIIFLNKYQFKAARGAETFISELAQRLSEIHEIKIVARINYLELLKSDFDAIIPTNGRWQVFIIRIISWLKGAKMIVSGQSGAGLDDRLNLYAFPDVFVALTKYQSEWARKINPKVRIETIPNGVDLSTYKGPPVKSAKNVVLSVGAFTREKRHDLTIKAVSKLKGIKLLIVGAGGSEKKNIQKLGVNLLGRNFEIKSMSHEEMPAIYKSASVFAFPSVSWESFGIAMLEAMATGLPVVATNDPIRREIVGDAGFLVDPQNSAKYSKLLQKALNTNWGQKPRTQASKYSWDDIAIKYNNLLISIINK